MLFESETFDTRFTKPASWSDHVFRYCEFRNFNTEGGDVGSAFIGCTLEDCEWYWGLFNLAIFVEVKFIRCRFRGTGFSGCKFIECAFIDCEFTQDNLNSNCSFDDSVWYQCTQQGCKGLRWHNK